MKATKRVPNWRKAGLRLGGKLAGGAAVLLMYFGCAAQVATGPDSDPTVGLNPDGSPRWVQKASGAYNGKYGKAFYGVGIVEGIRSESLARKTAGNRARGEIAALFKVYVATMMQDYQRDTSASGPEGGGSVQEQDIVSTQRTISEVTLHGVEIRDYWADPEKPALYALAVLELNKVVPAVSRGTLSPAAVEHVRGNAARAFDQMDQQLPKAGSSAVVPAVTPPGNAETSGVDAGRASAGDARRVGLRIGGRAAQTIQTCFANRILKAGFELIEGSSDVDFMVAGKLVDQPAGAVSGTVMVKSTINLRVTEQSTGRTLGAMTKSVKVSRPSAQAAQLTASTKLCDLVVPTMVSQIRSAIDKS